MKLADISTFARSLYSKTLSQAAIGLSGRGRPIVLALLVIIGAAIGIGVWEKNSELPNVDEKVLAQERVVWTPHIGQFTQDWVSADAVPMVRFTHPVIPEAMVGKLADDIVGIQPSHSIEAVFISTTVLEIRHADKFPSGKLFEISLSPKNLENVPQNLPDFRFRIKAIEQAMSINDIGLTADPEAEDGMILTGTLTTADKAATDDIEKIISAKQDDVVLQVTWRHELNNQHVYIIKGAKRKPLLSQITFAWKGESIGLGDNKGERTVDVPPKGEFSMTSVRAVTEPDSLIEVVFSGDLDKRQNLAGLVSLNNSDARVQLDGAIMRIYGHEKLHGIQQLHIEAAVQSAQGIPLKNPINEKVTFAEDLPGVRFAENGHVLPSAKRISIPIEAVAVNAVQLTAYEVYPNNIGQFLQDNNVTSNAPYELHKVGNQLWTKKILLPKATKGDWQRYSLDVNNLMANKRGSFIQLELSITKEFSTYPCGNTVADGDSGEGGREESDEEEGGGGYRNDAYAQRKNPCSKYYFSGSYYSQQNPINAKQLFVASNIGIMAKRGEDDSIMVLTTDLKEATPLAGTTVTAFNYQQQPIGSGSTNSDGVVSIHLEGMPFYLKATKGDDINYLKVADGDALATHMFNTGGAKSPKGLKGFFYGERDIWRPGDDIFLTFILMDRDKSLPADYPLTLDLYDPRNGKVSTVSAPKPTGSFYAFKLTTAANAPTGNWRAVVRAGGNSFEHVLRIESIVPNRLKMELAIPEEGLRLDGKNLKTSLQAQWLTGATAASLKANVQVKLARANTSFAAYDGYYFDDVSRSFSQDPITIYEDDLDENGRADIDTALDINEPPPGMLSATFTERVFEKGGQASTQYKTASIFPFATWIGMHPPAGNKSYYGSLDKNADHVFDFVSVDSKGKPLAKHAIELTVYKLEWRWWWDAREENQASYISNNIHALKATTSLVTDAKGHAKWTFQGNQFDWGRHLIRACDAAEKGKTQHCVSRDIYLGYGYNDGNNQAGDAAVTMILSGDKERYKVGDTAVVRLPAGPDRRVFVSIENGSRVIKSYWQDVRASANTLSVPVNAEMTPNAYVFVSAYQAHQQRNNDLPMRVYGILPILADDSDTHITPVISVPPKVRPQSKLTVKVSEQKGNAMTYTLAVVDEGLLGVSDYKTPDPHNYFYMREALGVKTWDLFDWVVGAYSTDLSHLLAVGGSDAAKKDAGNSREQRFPPIVKFIGPFALGAKATAEHSIDLPPYMGAVRVMVVAGNERAYGKAESTVTVTQPLVIHPTLPRVLGPGEEFNLPVDVFASEALVGNAKISVEADEFFSVIKGEETLNFTKPGEKMAFLRLKVKDRTGLAKVTIKGKLGSEQAQEVVNIPVRSANLPSSITEAKLVKPGEEWTPALVQHGMAGTNKTVLNVSSVPELRMEERLQYLIHYPYGCIEQTTSSVFPQIYLPALMEMSSIQRRDIDINVNAAIDRLKTFQTVSGGFSYWPYQSEVNPWGSNYAGHFLVEAKRLGYNVPDSLYRGWLNYQQKQSKSISDDHYADDSYRLYTLALAGEADLGGMNRLRERLARNSKAGYAMERWMLALAYEQAGQKAVAQELLTQAGNVVVKTDNWYWTYGSDLRDKSVLLMLYYRLGMAEESWNKATEIAADMSRGDWYSTQTTAWGLMSLASTFGSKAQKTVFAVRENGKNWEDVKSAKAMYKRDLAEYQPGKLSARNTSDHPLYVSVTNRGVPANTVEVAESKGLAINVYFKDMDGNALDEKSLPMGKDFVAEVTVRNLSDHELNNIALTEVVPSGWQIRNSRLEGVADNERIEYLDIRDDRQSSFFSLSHQPNYYSHYYWWRNNFRINESITIKMLLNASFAGRFYLPGWRVEPMYDGKIFASSAGAWVEVRPQ
jgi:uncharacterized protein YfaS (alpha-2-macroglobulin family)